MGKSESIAELAAALAKAQGEMSGAAKDGFNPGFKAKFATLASIWDAARGPLSKNGLSVTQVTYGAEDGTPMLETILMHSSGQWITGELALRLADNKPQTMGSALTYARRYALAAIVGIAPDDDDDGNEASKQPAQQQPRNGHQKPPQDADWQEIENAERKPAQPETPKATGRLQPCKPPTGPLYQPWMELSQSVAEDYPNYRTKEGNPDRSHMLYSLAHLKYAEIKDAQTLEQAIFELRAHAEASAEALKEQA